MTSKKFWCTHGFEIAEVCPTCDAANPRNLVWRANPTHRPDGAVVTLMIRTLGKEPTT